MLINFNHLQTFYNALKQKLKSHHGNWEQNDPNADDYIKNRPFYSEFGEVVVFSKTITAAELPFINYSPIIHLVDGQNYTVTFNGINYKCTAYLADGIIAVGNAASIGGNDTGEPFFIAINEEFGGAYVWFIGSDTCTISILTHGEIVHKIDSKYLPDDIGNSSGILDIERGGTGVDSMVDMIYYEPRYRASSLHSSETTPMFNGAICWTYE